MSERIWPDGRLSVVLLPSGTAGTELLDLAREWTREGLLSVGLWVVPEGVTFTSGPPTVKATVMRADGAGGVREQVVPLFDVLATQEIRLVRLIKVRSARPDQESDAVQDEIATRLGRYLAYSVPQLSPLQSGLRDTIEFLPCALVCAPTEFRLDERVGAERGPGLLLVASPEDRATPMAGDAFVRDDERFLGFVLIHVATVGGLWAGLPTGSLELFDRERSAPQSIWVQRVFVSGVLTNGLAERVAAAAIDELGRGEGGAARAEPALAAPGTSFIPADLESRYVDQLVESAASLEEGALRARFVPTDATPETHKLTVGGQLAAFARFCGTKLRKIPHWIRLWFHDRTARTLNRRLQGDAGRSEVELLLDVELDARDRMLISTVAHVDDVQARTRLTLDGTPAPGVTRAQPRLWADLRRLAFGAVDGAADHAVGGFDRVNGQIPIFRSRHAIGPHPDSAWTHPLADAYGVRQPVTWRDARSGGVRDKLEAALEKARRAVEEAAVAHEAAVASHQAAVDALEADRGDLVDRGILVHRADGKITASKKAVAADENGEADLARFRLLEQKAVSLENAARTAEAARGRALEAETEAAEILADFDAWRDGLASSFAWRLLDRMDAERRRVSDAIEEASRGGADLPVVGELVALRKRFHRGLLAAIVSVVALTALAIILPPLARAVVESIEEIPEQLRPIVDAIVDAALSRYFPEWWQSLLLGVGVILLAVLGLLTVYYRGWSRLERRTQLAEHRLHTLAGRARDLQVEQRRLASLHNQAEQWLETISTVVHRPWAVRDEWLDIRRPTLRTERLPYALHVADTVDEVSAGGRRLRDAAGDLLAKPGWLSAALAERVDKIAAELGRRGRFGFDALDEDVPEAPNGSRELLRSHLADERVLTGVAGRARERVLEALQTESLYDADIPVASIRDDPLAAIRLGADDSLAMPWMEFLTQTLGTAGDVPTPLSPLGIAPHEVQGAHHENVVTHIQAPQRIATELATHRRPSSTIHPYPRDPGSSFDVVVRIDLVGPVPISALGLWSRDRAPVVPVEPAVVLRRCSQCGRSECPAADPESGLPCDRTGV